MYPQYGAVFSLLVESNFESSVAVPGQVNQDWWLYFRLCNYELAVMVSFVGSYKHC